MGNFTEDLFVQMGPRSSSAGGFVMGVSVSYGLLVALVLHALSMGQLAVAPDPRGGQTVGTLPSAAGFSFGRRRYELIDFVVGDHVVAEEAKRSLEGLGLGGRRVSAVAGESSRGGVPSMR